MSDAGPSPRSSIMNRLRWWILASILSLAGIVLCVIRFSTNASHQEGNIRTMATIVISVALFVIWILAFSGLSSQVRLIAFGVIAGFIGLAMTLFEIKGVTGDLVPILVPRWSKAGIPSAPIGGGVSGISPSSNSVSKIGVVDFDYPQFLGPNRDCSVPPLPLAQDWKAHPPELLWRQPIGSAWTGFVTAGRRAVTQEQRGETEMVVCYDSHTGKILWSHADAAHYFTKIAGEGPRANPTIVSNRVYTIGGTGILNCLSLVSGECIWTKDIIKDNIAPVPEWGFSGSPLIYRNLVIVNAG